MPHSHCPLVTDIEHSLLEAPVQRRRRQPHAQRIGRRYVNRAAKYGIASNVFGFALELNRQTQFAAGPAQEPV